MLVLVWRRWVQRFDGAPDAVGMQALQQLLETGALGRRVLLEDDGELPRRIVAEKEHACLKRGKTARRRRGNAREAEGEAALKRGLQAAISLLAIATGPFHQRRGARRVKLVELRGSRTCLFTRLCILSMLARVGHPRVNLTH